MFKLKVGDVCRLNQVIYAISRKNDWKTGLYRVKAIYTPFCYEKDKHKPQNQSYLFEKIRKDGTPYKNFSNGYRCLKWDEWIDQGRVDIL